jgi:hypothetical protein
MQLGGPDDVGGYTDRRLQTSFSYFDFGIVHHHHHHRHHHSIPYKSRLEKEKENK